LPIVKSSPNLSSLWSFTKASLSVSLLLDDCGAEVMETVICASLPHHIQAIIRIIALIRNSSCQCNSLKEISDKYIGLRKSPTCPPLSPNTSPTELRSILASVHQIYLLTHSCLQYYINQSMSIQPVRVVDPHFSYACVVEPSQPPWKKRPEVQRYQPQNSGPPSWVEEQRVTRAFWWLKLFYDLINASTESRLHWPKEDIAKLKRNDIEGLGFDAQGELEELKTVMAYLRCTTDGRFKEIDSSVLQLPWPSQEVDVYWTSPEPIFKHFRGDKWEESIIYLDLGAQAINFAGGILTNSLWSPIKGVTFEPFRRFGFALWDCRRMVALGLLTNPEEPEKYLPGDSNGGLFYTWRSILSEEEVVRVDRELEEASLLRNNSLIR
jgi:hypothetical protein